PSTEPSQSLSTLSQSSGVGEPGAHESLPPTHVPVRAQAPIPQEVGKLSTVPSQLLSMLSQSSAEGAPGAQELFPATHVPVRAQAPTPQDVRKPSMVPSQLLSTLSQSSGAPGYAVGLLSLQSVADPPGHSVFP